MAFEIDVTRVRILRTKNYEPVGMDIVDMIYIADEPHFVFEWAKRDDGQPVPLVFFPIDANFLAGLPEGSETAYFYRAPVEDPR